MGLKKQLGMGVATAALGMSLVGGGTYAYFSDTTESTSHFTNGTINVQPEHEYLEQFAIEDWKPGDELNATWANHEPAITLNNHGTLPFNVIMDVDITSPENGEGQKKMGEVLQVTELKFGGENLLDDIRGDLGITSDDPVTLANLEEWTKGEQVEVNGKVAQGVEGKKIGWLGTDDDKDTQSLTYHIVFPETGIPQNELQGDKTDVDITFVALQEEGTLYNYENLTNGPGTSGGGTWVPGEEEGAQ